MRHPYRTVIVAVTAVVLLTGCSTLGDFRLLITVTNADTGQPLEGVTGVLDTGRSSHVPKDQLDIGHPLGVASNAAGQLSHEFRISPYPSDSKHWYLKLQKDGFEPLVIDIKPNPQPERDNKQHPLPITVEMKPLPKKP